MRFESAAVRDRFVKVGMQQGWSQSLDKLSRALTSDREIAATRVLDMAASKGILKRENASRRIGRLARAVHQLGK